MTTIWFRIHELQSAERNQNHSIIIENVEYQNSVLHSIAKAKITLNEQWTSIAFGNWALWAVYVKFHFDKHLSNWIHFWSAILSINLQSKPLITNVQSANWTNAFISIHLNEFVDCPIVIYIRCLHFEIMVNDRTEIKRTLLPLDEHSIRVSVWQIRLTMDDHVDKSYNRK